MEILKEGSRGALVQRLQLGLGRAGENPGTPDGIFGEQTRQAVLAFQEKNGLRADGTVGAQTQRALRPWYQGYVRHRIRQGDTLWQIAKQYHTGLQALETANPGTDPLQLQPGQWLTVPLDFSLVPFGISYSAALVGDCVQGLAARYPFLRTGEMGKSVLGKPLYWLRWGRGKRRVLYNAAHHANEWITTPVLLRFLEELCRIRAGGGMLYGVSARQLWDTAEITLVPMVDPDGVDLVTGAMEPGTALRQTEEIAGDFPRIAYPEGWKANIQGVDLNLQYPANWDRAREIKFAQGYTKPAPRDYVGAAPLSAPEARAMARLTRIVNPALTLSLHTQGEVIYWRFGRQEPPGGEALGERLAQASGYSLETTPDASDNAGYKDWFIQEYDRPSYTIECGRGENPLPLAQLPEIYQKTLGILVLAALG